MTVATAVTVVTVAKWVAVPKCTEFFYVFVRNYILSKFIFCTLVPVVPFVYRVVQKFVESLTFFNFWFNLSLMALNWVFCSLTVFKVHLMTFSERVRKCWNRQNHSKRWEVLTSLINSV
jgi:hypothetical protein